MTKELANFRLRPEVLAYLKRCKKEGFEMTFIVEQALLEHMSREHNFKGVYKRGFEEGQRSVKIQEKELYAKICSLLLELSQKNAGKALEMKWV